LTAQILKKLTTFVPLSDVTDAKKSMVLSYSHPTLRR
jgi:hypothetical protein